MKSVLQKRLFAWCPIPLKSIVFLNSQADPKLKKKKKNSEGDTPDTPKIH